MPSSSRVDADRVEIGASVPRTQRPVLAWLARRLLRLCGWRLDIVLPDAPRMVVLAAPHTSNWDGFFAITTMLALNLRLGLFAKHTMFGPPFGALLRWVGAIPIDRRAAGGLVGQTVQAFHQRPQLVIALAPEGTRKRNAEWKRGFHLIASGAGVPVVCAYLDYGRKVIGTGLILDRCGDYATDLAQVQAFYRTITPHTPANFSMPG